MGKEQRGPDGFTKREREFCLHYVGGAAYNATEAAIMAGYCKQGTRSTARRVAYEVMQRPHVVAEIQRLVDERAATLSITAEDILRDLAVLKTEAETLPRSVQTIKARREILKDLGEHIHVGAFRRQLGLSNPKGGPIETVDLAILAKLTNEELEIVERAREILDRIGASGAVPDRGSDQGGEGAPTEGE